jgi:DNA-binding beta-propeller fold protein YncE
METGLRPTIVTAFFASVALLLALVSTPAKSAVQPKPLYAMDTSNNTLVAFDLETQTLIGTPRNIGLQSLALAFCPSGGLVPYTITNPFFPGKAQLATINLAAGAPTLVGSPLPLTASGQALDIMGMTCSRQGTLYAIGDFDPTDPDFNSLYTIDRQTGQPTRIGSTGVQVPAGEDFGLGFFMALAFAPDGTLYGANDFALYRIDPSTGYASKIVDFVGVTQPPSVMGLAIDSRGIFYVADEQPASRVYTVDTTTGVATPILNPGLTVHNIAFRVPF